MKTTPFFCPESDKSEFVAVYGRRRVGKTFLVKEFFEAGFAFYSTGILNGDREAQLQAWNNEMLRFGGSGSPAAKEQTTMITTFGLKQNAYSAEIVSEVVLDDLFE